MKPVRTCCSFALLLLVAGYAFSAAPSRRQVNDAGRGGVVPGVIVMKMKSGSPAPGALLKGSSRADQILQAAGVRSVEPAFRSVHSLSKADAAAGKVDLSLIYIGRIPASADPVTVAGTLDRSGAFEYVEPKYLCYLRDVPNDSAFLSSQEWYFAVMNAMNGWSVAKGDTNVVIADVDGGTFWQHPDLVGNLWINKAEDANHDGRFEHGAPPAGDENGIDDDHNGFVDDVIGWNFANNSNDPTGISSTPENASHGTATASLVDAVTNNGIGIAGAAWNCRLMLIDAASSTQDNTISFGFEGIQYAAANGAKIINCSWGRLGGASKFEQDVVNAVTQEGALVVAAAGNDGQNSDFNPQYPANYPNVLAVGATASPSDDKASFSNYGTNVPVYAPGVNIWGALTNGGYANIGAGTSFSTPLVAGLAGLLKSLHPTWTPAQIATQIRVTADPMDANPLDAGLAGSLGHGRVNYARALQENHAGIEIKSFSIASPSGGVLFLPGDTVVLKVTVRNVLFTSAGSLTFTASTSDSSLAGMQGSTDPVTLAPEDSLVLPELRFKVGTPGVPLNVLIKLAWVSNVNEQDAFAFKVRLFPTPPVWMLQKSPTPVPLAAVAAVNPNVGWAAGGNQDGSAPVVLRTMDAGANWKDVTGSLSGVAFYTMAAMDSARALVGTGDGRIFGTTDGGVTWAQRVYPGVQSPFIDGIKMFADGSGFALGDPASGGKFVILYTSDGGATWGHIANEPVGAANEAGWNNAFWWTDRQHGWFGTSNTKIWRTTDGGITWLSGATPIPNSIALAFSDNLHGIAGYPGGSITASGDGGATWAFVPSPTSQQIAAVTAIPGTSLFWLTDGINPYMSRDEGQDWAPQTYFPFDGSAAHLALADTSSGWLVTSNGEILRYGPDTLAVQPPNPPTIPTSYLLLQNFPNPFNPGTFIPFDLPYDSRVTIRVYDILGRSVRLLVDGNFAAGPHHQDVRFDGSGLASGVYFYRMQAESVMPGAQGSYSAVKKMLLLR